MKRLFLLSLLILSVFLFAVVGFCENDTTDITKVTATITAQNQFTDAITPKYAYNKANTGLKRQNDFGIVNLAVYNFGTSVATVTLQYAYDFGTAWIDYPITYTDNTIKTITSTEAGMSYRLGVKTGDFTSSTNGINVRLSR